jgi:lipoprotein-releasing system permease protein
MNVAFFIAKRYFFAKKKKNLINILARISMIGVAVSTMALVVVMSAFNGLEKLTLSLYASHHAELQITAKIGKTFSINDTLLASLKAIKGVKAVTEVIEDNALLRYGDVQAVVNVKGLSDNFNEQYDLSSKLATGQFLLKTNQTPYCLLGIGVATQLSVNLQDELKPLVFWYPKRQKNVQLDVSKAFVKLPILAKGTLSVEQKFDENNVYVPLEFANELMNYGYKRTSLEIKTTDYQYIKTVQSQIQELLGNDFFVKNTEQQQESLMRAVRIERLFVFIAFSFILAISSFNIFFSLAMLAIEKRKDIAVLMSLGANKVFIKNIFLFEGMIISAVGAFSGLLLGILICVLQQEFGMIGLGLDSSVIDAYPVELKFSDLIAIVITVIIITLTASYIPSQNATAVKINEQL